MSDRRLSMLVRARDDDGGELGTEDCATSW